MPLPESMWQWGGGGGGGMTVYKQTPCYFCLVLVLESNALSDWLKQWSSQSEVTLLSMVEIFWTIRIFIKIDWRTCTLLTSINNFCLTDTRSNHGGLNISSRDWVQRHNGYCVAVYWTASHCSYHFADWSVLVRLRI